MSSVKHENQSIGTLRVDRISLIPQPTDVHELNSFSARLKMDSPILIKREDQTSPRYGGNKVRNLEYLLAEALSQGHSSVKTLLPYGSNFSAALSSEARHAGLKCHLHQFTVELNDQTDAHFHFSKSQRARVQNHSHKLKHPASALSYLSDIHSYAIPPGASSMLGAIGHFQAFKEFCHQYDSNMQRRHIDYLILGTGTCGTTAGILAAITHFQLKTKVIGIRCADPLVCRSNRIHRLANQVLSQIGSEQRTHPDSLILYDPPFHKGYGISSPEAIGAAQRFYQDEGINLDLTYTSKVILGLEHLRSTNNLHSKDSLLYWHTYSSHFDSFLERSA